ncbi:MAG: D-alanyl-D-alanine carboxypeptidase family protein [Hyphomicrobiaceae bacterium]
MLNVCNSSRAIAAASLLMASTMSAVEANPVLLFEPATGQVLYAEEPDRLWYPASVTKLMTAYLTFDAVKTGRLAWDDDVPLSDHARGQPATRIGLRAGIKLNVEQAIRGLVLRSANDFAVALAERVGGTEDAFVLAMNDTAKRLGMTRTVFRNPHGLPDPDQVTTARDLATLTTALLKDFPDRAEVFSTQTVRIHKGTFHSQNDLLRSLEGADGMKTGFTCASGYNVVASATRDGHRLIAIVLGEYNRNRRSERATELIEAGFAHLSGDPALRTAVVVSPAAPIKLRHAAAVSTEPHPFMPVTLRNLAVEPPEPMPPGNVGRDLRARTCWGYSGFSKPEPEHEHDGDDEVAQHVVTGSVAKASGTVTHANAAAVTIRKKPAAVRRADGTDKIQSATAKPRKAITHRQPRNTIVAHPATAAVPSASSESAMHLPSDIAPPAFGN